MLSSQDIRSVTELRTKTTELLQEVAKRRNPLYIVSRSKLQAVLASVDLWNKLTQDQETRKVLEDPFAKMREKYGYPFANLKVVSTIRKAREKRCI